MKTVAIPFLDYLLQERGTLLLYLPRRSFPAKVPGDSSTIQVLLPSFLPLFFRGGCLILRVQLPIHHGVPLLFKFSLDGFIEVVHPQQMVANQIEEQILGNLHVLHRCFPHF